MLTWSSKGFNSLTARPERLRAGAEIALALVLILQIAHLGWIVLEPGRASAAANPAGATAKPVDYSVFQRFDAFFMEEIVRAEALGRQIKASAARKPAPKAEARVHDDDD